MPGSDFTYDQRRFRTATVTPPGPFTGTAHLDLGLKAGSVGAATSPSTCRVVPTCRSRAAYCGPISIRANKRACRARLGNSSPSELPPASRGTRS